jgi:protein-tyrosine kinase
VDRIRRALDLARLERAQAGELPVVAPEAPTAPAASGAPEPISYVRSHVFTPSSELLERNRIFGPGSAESAAVAYQMLRTQVLQRMDANGWRTLAVFSPGAHDGKTTTAINLAASLAGDQLHTVLLVEFDFKRPTLALRFGFSPDVGSDDAISRKVNVQDCLYHPQGFERLILMPSRSTLGNSAELLAGPRSRSLVAEIRARYPERIILFDLPPVLAADDALSFAPLVECGLVVASEGLTRRTDLLRTIEILHKTPLLGTVLNRAVDAPTGY